LRACRAHVIQVLLHDPKAEGLAAVPRCAAPAVRGPRRPDQRRRRLCAVHAEKIDAAEIYAKALRALPETVDGQAPLAISDVYPVTLDELLSAV
jgi:hypothetical protein